MTQSMSNPSPPEIPANREKIGKFDDLSSCGGSVVEKQLET
jgi:hypothetical protein